MGSDVFLSLFISVAAIDYYCKGLILLLHSKFIDSFMPLKINWNKLFGSQLAKQKKESKEKKKITS